jgi:diaminopimelate decarboxylase
MHHFQYQKDELYCEAVPIARIAQAVGTPFFLYSSATLKQHFKAFDSAFEGLPHMICFSMKTNSNMAILRLLVNLGGGVDIVSGGELFRALKAGVQPQKIVYSGVGKRLDELEYGLQAGILMFNVESVQEIQALNEVARRLDKPAPISMRVNPDIDAQTHPYISTGLKKNKFGIDIHLALEEYIKAAALSHLNIIGLSCHLGSQITQLSPFVEALKKLMGLVRQLAQRGLTIRFLDLGGGLGITYDAETPPHPREYAAAIKAELHANGITLILEPGRVMVGNAGILVAKVLYTKETSAKNFIITDAAMNDLVRPSLYGAFHAIQPVQRRERLKLKSDVVGPICESSDFLARDREIEKFEAGELLAVMSAGAYGFSMSSNYNSRVRAAEVLVNENEFYVIRARESYEDLIRGEQIPEFLRR